MKQPKKLTRAQKEIVSANGLNPNDWFFLQEMDFYIKIVHRTKGTTKMIDKFRKGGNRR